MENKKEQTKPKYQGERITTNGNQLVAAYTEALICDGGVFYPITPSTEQGENYQLQFAKGQLNAFGKSSVAIEAEGEHAAQGGAIAFSITGKRAVNFTSGQGIVYGIEQYYHAPGKLSTMVLEVGARALTKSALNVHAGHDDFYAALDTGWSMCFAKDAQQASDQAIILRKVTELSLNPGMNAQDGFLTTHLERTFYKPEPALIREFLGNADDIIECPNDEQKALFGETRKRVPATIDLKNPVVMGPVQNQEHYMNSIAARRNNFSEQILDFFEEAYEEFGQLTGRNYGLISEYRCEDADTVFVALGSAAENIEAAVDYLRETRGERVGVIHINVIRPFPENAVINALKGKRKVIILERTDESMAGDNPLTREIRVTLDKAIQNDRYNAFEDLEKMTIEERPEIISGVYGLGSRDFRQEGIIGAYDFAWGKVARKDGKKYGEGINFFYVGIEHPYAVESTETPSGLPNGAIAIRMHSIGGWGMITTGKNMSEILGEFSTYVAQRDNLKEEDGTEKEVIHVSANPKYGSEKKGAPTNYFLVAAPDRIRVNCDLKHVDVVLCPDPKIFLHTNALEGLKEGGVFVWESGETTSEAAWQRIPKKYRQEVIDKNIQLYILHGFDIAKAATNKPELQTRMQGNAFLGAFFNVSTFLNDYKIPEEEYRSIVKAQYVKKFGRFGDTVVESNMQVMEKGYSSVIKVEHGDVEAEDRSNFTGKLLTPAVKIGEVPVTQPKAPMFSTKAFDAEFRSGLGYYQPSSPLASTGVMAAATGATASKYVARREVPVWDANKCVACLDCLTVCPDTALPSMAQSIETVLKKAVELYVSEEVDRNILLENLGKIEDTCRKQMVEVANSKEDDTLFNQIFINTLKETEGVSEKAANQLEAIFEIFPIAFKKTNAIFKAKEKKQAGAGGLFSLNISDLCKGCGACVVACGNRGALKMMPETEENRAKNESALIFFKQFQDTPKEYLGLFNPEKAEESKAVALRNHLMMYSKYNALVAGDGACAGCGEKSTLRVISTLTETIMRPIFHKKADRLREKAAQLEEKGAKVLAELQAKDENAYNYFKKSILHLLVGLGGANEKDTDQLIADKWDRTDKELIDVVVAVLRQDAFNHKDLQAIEGNMPNGMCAMAMTANTGCNSVYGSTPPNNPHSYPWMNSLFQDGATIGWLIGESFMQTHSRTSVIPERLADVLLEEKGFCSDTYFCYTHFSDTYMTDQEVLEMPKVWAIGGDGAMGDIGYQNVSKAVLQNRPNVHLLLLDTQVYSNTGGQNSDSSVMTGGFDMNQFGAATEGKLTEKKSVAETFLNGHGSPFIVQSSIANISNLYKGIVDGIFYRGMAFVQAYTPCQPEHGIADFASPTEARYARDSRSVPEFISDPRLGESYEETLSLKGNPDLNRDWQQKTIVGTKEKYDYTVAHFAFREARFRNHFKVAKAGASAVEGMVSLDKKLQLMKMDDFTYRRFLDKNHRSYVPKNGVYVVDYNEKGEAVYYIVSRQMVLFALERRKSWRMLQSRAGVENTDYKAQKELLKKIDGGQMTVEEFLNS